MNIRSICGAGVSALINVLARAAHHVPAPLDVPKYSDRDFEACRHRLRALGAGLYRSDPRDGPIRYFGAIGSWNRKARTLETIERRVNERYAAIGAARARRKAASLEVTR